LGFRCNTVATERTETVAKIVKPPKPRRIECDECQATIEYLPEEVKERHGTDYGGGPDGARWVLADFVHERGGVI
jgi:hypothetical protein